MEKTAAAHHDPESPRELVTPPADFLTDLKQLDARRFIRKRLIFGGCSVYPDPHAYFELVECVANRFEVHPAEVFVVGSAKLGFSIAPQKRYLAFHDKSDIDLVIVSESLFDRVWREFFREKGNDMAWPRRERFLKYLFRGWLRPDFFPDVHGTIADDWWDFFQSVSRDAPAKVAGAIYRTWDFFEAYQSRCVKLCAEAEDLR